MFVQNCFGVYAFSLRFKTEPKFDAVNLMRCSSYHNLSSDCPLVLHSMFCISSFDLNSVLSINLLYCGDGMCLLKFVQSGVTWFKIASLISTA